MQLFFQLGKTVGQTEEAVSRKGEAVKLFMDCNCLLDFLNQTFGGMGFSAINFVEVMGGNLRDGFVISQKIFVTIKPLVFTEKGEVVAILLGSMICNADTFDFSCKGLPMKPHLSHPTYSLFTITFYFPKIGPQF